MGKKSAGQLLAERRLPETVVPVCLRLDVLADIYAAEQELQKLRDRDTGDGDVRLMDDPRVAELGDEILRLEAIADEHTLQVRLRAFKRSRWRALLDEHRSIDKETGKDTGADIDKVIEAAVPESIVEPEMSKAETADLLEGLSEGQWESLYNAVWELNRRDVAVGKSVLGSLARQKTAAKPRPDARLA